MNPDTYKLIFDAQIKEGADLRQVQARLAS